MTSQDTERANLADLGADLLSPGIAYFGPGEVVPGVMWVALTRSGCVWSRQLCTVYRLRQPSRPAAAQLVLDL